jgi:hypothetical protein
VLQAVFPDARVIHVVRDGRAVANSWLQMRWWDGWEGPSRWYLGPLPVAYQEEWEQSGRSFVLLAGLGWKILIDAFEAARPGPDSGHWMDVRYEDMLADPRGQFERIMKFLDLPWDEGFEAGFSRHEFLPARAEAYREELGERQVRLLEASLAGHLEAWGYEVAAT